MSVCMNSMVFAWIMFEFVCIAGGVLGQDHHPRTNIMFVLGAGVGDALTFLMMDPTLCVQCEAAFS